MTTQIARFRQPFSGKTALKLLLAIVGVVLGVVLAWMTIRNVSWSSMEDALGRMSWDVLVPAVAAAIVATVLQAIRWKLLLPGESVSTARLFLVRNAGLTVNNLALARGVLGEASELAMLTHSDNICAAKVTASIFMSRALDFLVTSAFLLAGFIVLPQLSGFRAVIVPVFVVAAVILAVVLLAKRISRLPILKKVKAVESSLHEVHALGHHSTLWLSVSLTVLAPLLLGTAAWLVAQALGIHLSFWMVGILLVSINLLAGIIPSGFSGIGVYEFAAVSVLGLFAVNRSDALAFAMIVHALVVFPALIIGIPTLCREQRAFRGVAGQVGVLFGRSRGDQPLP